ncbi:MAG: gluconate 2-dehydrogenase subunit 3 family protein [Bryobacterales bacterium]
MAEQPTRRAVLVQIAAATAATTALSPPSLQAQVYTPQNLSAAQYQMLTALVDLIIPPSDTPGAAAAGADQLIDESLTRAQQRRTTLTAGLEMLEKDGFSGLDQAARVNLLTQYSEAAGERGEFFQLLKDMTVDAYYSTEIGLAQELGYQGNTYLREFPGCQHEEHQ